MIDHKKEHWVHRVQLLVQMWAWAWALARARVRARRQEHIILAVVRYSRKPLNLLEMAEGMSTGELEGGSDGHFLHSMKERMYKEAQNHKKPCMNMDKRYQREAQGHRRHRLHIAQ